MCFFLLFKKKTPKKTKKMFSCLASTNPSGALKTGPSLHPQFRLIFFDPAARPVVPGSARSSGAGRARSNPYTHAPELKKALVGKAQTPSNYYCDYYLFFLFFLFSFLFFYFCFFFLLFFHVWAIQTHQKFSKKVHLCTPPPIRE